MRHVQLFASNQTALKASFVNHLNFSSELHKNILVRIRTMTEVHSVDNNESCSTL